MKSLLFQIPQIKYIGRNGRIKFNFLNGHFGSRTFLKHIFIDKNHGKPASFHFPDICKSNPLEQFATFGKQFFFVHDAYEKYLELRKDYLHTPLFYYDVATWFFAKKESKVALKILSAITDLDIENEELYKLISYKLKQENQKEKLLFVTKKVLDWRPMDAQSYRDYGLALEDNGQYQLVRDFSGIKATGFDGRGNYNLGVLEQIIFPEIDIDKVNKISGMDITFVTSAATDKEAKSLLAELGLPFKKN